MSVFPLPEIDDFFDERLIISWKLTQPPHLPPLKNLLIQISGDPQLIFDPLQDPKLNIDELTDSDLIINWVIRKPITKTEVTFFIQNNIISEKYNLLINPENFPQTM